MRRDDKPYTDDQAAQLIAEVGDYRIAQGAVGGKPLPFVELSRRAGIAVSTLSEMLDGKYKGNPQRWLRKIDEFLARERQRAGRLGLSNFRITGIVQAAFAVIDSAVKYNSMALVTGPPGCGKTCIARGFAGGREGPIVVRIDEANGTQHGVTMLLCRALGLDIAMTHRRRLAAIVDALRKDRSVVLLIDEAQKLKASGLEILRDIHDLSDPEATRNTPTILFGDQDFYQLLMRARAGESSVIRPQLSRRFYPVLDLAKRGSQDGDGQLFTADDVTKIVANSRVRLVTDKGIRWLSTLANVQGYGTLGFALAILRMAHDLAQRRGPTDRSGLVDVPDLQKALKMALGPKVVAVLDESIGGQLLAKAG